MFPASFAERVIGRHTERGGVVLDPFSGRGTAIFAAAAKGRFGVGVEINPVGYVYTKTKLQPARRELVEQRIRELGVNAWRYRKAAGELPAFFASCFCPDVRAFLLTARNWLDWKTSSVDCTVMAFLLVHMHGKRTDSLSNQMRQTKSMSPQYAMRWWRERNMKPPQIMPADFIINKLDWRYAKGRPALDTGRVILGDSEQRIQHLPRTLESMGLEKVNLLLTSPPYCGVTNYHYDQWLRLWLLGGPDAPTAAVGPNQGKFFCRQHFRTLLTNVFTSCAALLAKDAVVYVRTDSRKLTLNTTSEVLRDVFPGKKMTRHSKPFKSGTQTTLFGGKSSKGEVDLILR